jgi:hypothetical protein
MRCATCTRSCRCQTPSRALRKSAGTRSNRWKKRGRKCRRLGGATARPGVPNFRSAHPRPSRAAAFDRRLHHPLRHDSEANPLRLRPSLRSGQAREMSGLRNAAAAGVRFRSAQAAATTRPAASATRAPARAAGR